MEDYQIIALYWSRNESAIRETDKKYGRLLQGISNSILSDAEDVEEIISDTYSKAWDSIPPSRPRFLSAYLGRITRNLSINLWHKNRAQKRYNGAEILLSELGDCIPSDQGVEGELEIKELTGAIERWLKGLSTDDRVLFMRRYWFGQSLKSLAYECGTSPNKLASRMYRLRKRLRSFLEGEEIDI